MLKITLHHMRTGWARLAAAGLAIVLGSAFVAATLLAGQTMRNTAYQSFTASYAGSDLVITGGAFEPDQLEQIAATNGVEAVDPRSWVGMQLGSGQGSQWVSIGSAAPIERMQTGELTDGTLPQRPGEIAVASEVADRLGVGVGDTLDYVSPGDEHQATAEVTGLIAPVTSFFSSTTDVLFSPEEFASIVPADFYDSLAVATDRPDDAAAVAAVQADLAAQLGPDMDVRTLTEVAEDQVAGLTGDAQTFTMLLLAFAAVALAVAALVITNTFTVLVAQRTRLLALLRAIGATRGQVRRSVLLEAAILGLIASAVGLVLGIGLVVGGSRILDGYVTGIDVSSAVEVTTATIIAPLVTGLAVTVIAGWLPARNATRVSPLAALRPLDGANSAGRIRAGISLALVVLGAVMLAGGVLVSTRSGSGSGTEMGLLLGIPGGFVSVFGILLGAVYVVPRSVRLLGAPTHRRVAGRIATENAVRNPRRTATTTNALVIGVALVAMMSTGAATGQRALEQELTSNYPVDLFAASVDETIALTPEQRDAVTTLEGVDAVSFGRQTSIDVITAQGSGPYLTVTAPEDAAAVVQNPADVADLDDESILISATTAATFSLHTGDTVHLGGPDGPQARLVVNSYDGYSAIVTPKAMSGLAPDAAENVAWIALEDSADAIEVGNGLIDAMTRIGESDPSAPIVEVDGTAIQRASFGQVIDTLLAVVLGLLGVAVIIALVGVANTLSLSVLERRRESAVLRAMGLTKGQLRGMLAIEGVLIASVGTLIGLVAGVIYGWAGASVLLGQVGQVALAIPWGIVAAVVVVAIMAGLLASVLPARTAVRTSPVAALAEE